MDVLTHAGTGAKRRCRHERYGAKRRGRSSWTSLLMRAPQRCGGAGMSAPAVQKAGGLDAGRLRRLLPAYGVYAALLVLVLFNVAYPDSFLEWSNLRIQLVQV